METPATIGPYRLEGRLGRGGMGEVYRGYDERLDRPVALKRLARAAGASAHARRRLRREARAAARLNHPAVVQVYDVVYGEDEDWIVMELVEGRTLAALADGKALPVADALRWARQVAEGLATAHARGIVHRDLKAENVMIDDGGAAKILDFGLAKHVVDAGAVDAGATATTEDGMVVGTVRALSPEQAMGRSIDARSDLFALGILLYETVAGRSPFIGAGPADTLRRICASQQTPLREIDAALPAALSELVDQLLAKEPALRPRSAAEVARRLAALEDEEAIAPASSVYPGTTLLPASGNGADVRPWRRPATGRWLLAAAAAVVAAVAAWRLLPSSPLPVAAAPEPLYVATLPPLLVNGGDLPGMDLMADGVRVALLRGLVSLEGVAALAPERVDAVDGPPRAVARAVAADEVLSSRLSCRRDACTLTVSRLTPDERVSHTETIEVPTDDFALLARAVSAQVRRVYGEHPWRSGAPEPAMASAEYETFLRLRGDYLARRRPLPELLEEIEKLSPRVPEILLLKARVARYRYAETRDGADLDLALAAVEAARRLAPDDPEVLAEAVQVARAGDDAELATTALAALETLTPGDAGVAISRAWWLERRGEADAALELVRRAARRRPAWYALLGLANLEIQHGDAAAARRALSELLERAPGQYTGLSLLAQLELTSGDLGRAVELYAELVRRSPGPIQQSNLGLAYLLSRRYEEAAASFAAAYEAAPNNPLVALNLADARLLTGERAGAEALYRRVLELDDRNPESHDWQDLATRAQAEARLGLGRQAVASIRDASRLAPDSPHAAYCAALVFLLVGEEASAVVEAERALDLGLEPRWFDLEWFDALREDRLLADRLTEAAR